MTIDRMNTRKQALEDLVLNWTYGGLAIDGETASGSFQSLTEDEKNLVRLVFLKEVSNQSDDQSGEII